MHTLRRSSLLVVLVATFLIGSLARAETSELTAETTFSYSNCDSLPGDCTHETFENLDGRVGIDLAVSTLEVSDIAYTPSLRGDYSMGYAGIAFAHQLDAPVGYVVYTLRIRLGHINLYGSAHPICTGLPGCQESKSYAYLEAHGESRHLSCGSCSSWGRTSQPGRIGFSNGFVVFDSSKGLNLESQEVVVTLAHGNCDSTGLIPVPAGNVEVRSALLGDLRLAGGEQGSLRFSAEGSVVSVLAETHQELPSDDIFCA